MTDIVERIRNAVKKSPTPAMIRQNNQIVKLRQYAVELEAAVASGDMRLIAEKSAQSRAYLDHLKAERGKNEARLYDGLSP